jgi:zona occludens toxin (predicted ATPase)
MAKEPIPNDPYRSGLSDDDFSRQARLDDGLRFDPEAPQPISAPKVTLFAVAIALVLGAVFYGLNNTSVHQAETAPPAQTAQSHPQTAPPGIRPNTNPGVTTGQAPSSAPVRPATPDNNN